MLLLLLNYEGDYLQAGGLELGPHKGQTETFFSPPVGTKDILNGGKVVGT